MTEYESNSHKSREARGHETPEKKVGKVVTGEVVISQKSGIRKFADALIAEGIDNIRDYVIRDIVAPKARDMISDTVRRLADGVSDGVDKLLYGESDRYYSETRPRQYGSYYGNAQTVTYRNSGFRNEDFIFRSRGDAEMTLRELRELLDHYNIVSVADFYACVGKDASSTDNNYGWTSLKDAKIRQVRGGYILELPRSAYLGD